MTKSWGDQEVGITSCTTHTRAAHPTAGTSSSTYLVGAWRQRLLPIPPLLSPFFQAPVILLLHVLYPILPLRMPPFLLPLACGGGRRLLLRDGRREEANGPRDGRQHRARPWGCHVDCVCVRPSLLLHHLLLAPLPRLPSFFRSLSLVAQRQKPSAAQHGSTTTTHDDEGVKKSRPACSRACAIVVW